MSKKPYDFLSTDKEPLLYFDKSKIVMKDGMLVSLNENGIINIPPSSILIMMLGYGTSITQEAAIFSAENDMQIAFVKAGINVHSFFMSGRYKNPIGLVNQVNWQQTKKLEIAKKLMLIRFTFSKDFDIKHLNFVNSVDNIEELILYEARWIKNLYKSYCYMYKINDFKRDFSKNDKINERLNILNNVMYNLTTAVILSCGGEPSIGFIHGYTRRGGLTFDIADIFKPNLVLDISFKSNKNDIKKDMYLLFNEIKKQNVVKNMVKVTLAIVSNNMEELDKLIDYNNFK